MRTIRKATAGCKVLSLTNSLTGFEKGKTVGDELEIKRNAEGDKAVFVLEGNLSTISSPYLKDAIDALDGVSNIVVDISAIDYISDAGFELLASVRDELAASGGSLTIEHPNDILADMIADLGLKEQFQIVE